MTIGIIGAMDEEIDLLKSRMTHINKKEVANVILYSGLLENVNVVLLKSGIGKVNAALSTTIMHEMFSPRLIINAGSAGGLKKGLSVGDIVISDEVTHHDVDATVFDYKLGQVPQMPENFKADKALVKIVESSIQALDLNCSIGLIATGDSFVGSNEQVSVILKNFPEVLAAEMEAAAIAQVCYQYNTPFVVIRALSDIAGKDSSISFDEFLVQAADNSAKVIIETIKKIKNKPAN